MLQVIHDQASLTSMREVVMELCIAQQQGCRSIAQNGNGSPWWGAEPSPWITAQALERNLSVNLGSTASCYVIRGMQNHSQSVSLL